MTEDERGALALDETELVALSAALAAGDPDRVAVRLDAAAASVDPVAVEEAILQSYLFVGFPAALNALARWREGRPAATAPTEGDGVHPWRERGERVCRAVYGGAYDALREGVARLHPDVEAWMVREGYGKVIGRPGLALPLRELCIVGLLAAQDAPRQLHSHLRGALNVGVSEARVAAALEVALAEVARARPRNDGGRAVQHRRVWDEVRRRHRTRHGESTDLLEE